EMVAGGVRICEFPVAVKREVIRPHSSVFRIVEAERVVNYGSCRGTGQGGATALENISYGQLQAHSTVPADSPSLSAVAADETANGCGTGSYVITPPSIVAGRGITKRFGSAGRVHVMPVHSAEWFSPNSVHRLERQVVPHFFSGRSVEHTPEKYMECRNFIVAKHMEDPEKYLSAADCQGLVDGIDHDDLNRIVRFLDHWGIINYCATSPKEELQKEGANNLYENSNGELCVPSAGLKSIDSLIKFDKPKCRLKAGNVYPEVAHHEEDSGIDYTIREQLSDRICSFCSKPVPTVHYQSQREIDVRLCSDCFHEGRFVVGHSSLDFMKENSVNDYGDTDGDSWGVQETLLLLEGIQLYKENWNRVAEHVGSKSKSQCILHFVRLPLDGVPLIDVAFLASALGPRVAAACAHASLSSLSKDSGTTEGTNPAKKGPWNQDDANGAAPLTSERVKAAAEDGLAAAAMKAKLFADHEEREIQRLSANIINQELKRLELKLKQFAEIETLLMRECEQMERTRQRIGSERALIISSKLGSAAAGSSSSRSSLGAPNPRQQQQQQQQQHFGPTAYDVSLMQLQQQQQQQGGMMMYGVGPRLPLSTILPSSSSNPMFNNSPASHSMMRPLSGTKSGLG
ncbi:chromatin remodeling complex subunit, partial [Genlisea aurea]